MFPSILVIFHCSCSLLNFLALSFCTVSKGYNLTVCLLVWVFQDFFLHLPRSRLIISHVFFVLQLLPADQSQLTSASLVYYSPTNGNIAWLTQLQISQFWVFPLKETRGQDKWHTKGRVGDAFHSWVQVEEGPRREPLKPASCGVYLNVFPFILNMQFWA